MEETYWYTVLWLNAGFRTRAFGIFRLLHRVARTTRDQFRNNRTPEQERYASSILALNATTGKLAWSYQ
ncbi:PQQ-binding-like beta-propeller repeat protein, partial [Escherichia coli]|nr:PQQ-binding-like beta-propeller repeat protein [Escherichia coli]